MTQVQNQPHHQPSLNTRIQQSPTHQFKTIASVYSPVAPRPIHSTYVYICVNLKKKHTQYSIQNRCPNTYIFVI